MLSVLKFILQCVIDFIEMLFTIDLGFTNLGVLMCICYILFPILLLIVKYLKTSLMDELDDRYDDKIYPIRRERRELAYKKYKRGGK